MWAHLGIVTLEPEKLVVFVLILLLFSYILTAVADAQHSTAKVYQMIGVLLNYIKCLS